MLLPTSGSRLLRLWTAALAVVTLCVLGGCARQATAPPPGEQAEQESAPPAARPAATVVWSRAQYTGLVAYSPDGALLATPQGMGRIPLYNAKTGELVRTIVTNHGGAIRAVAFSPDGQQLASGADDGRVKLWKVADGAALHAVDAHKGGVTALAFSRDGALLASGGADHKVRLWKMADGKPLREMTQEGGDAAGSITGIAFTPDGQRIAAGSQTTICVWQVGDGALVKTVTRSDKDQPDALAFNIIGNAADVPAMAMAPDGSMLVSAVGPEIKLWRPDGTPVGSVPTGFGFYDAAVLRAFAFAPNGRFMLAGDGTGRIRIWQMPAGQPAGLLTIRDGINIGPWNKDKAGTVCSLAYSAQGLVAAGNVDGIVREWDMAAPAKVLRTRDELAYGIAAAALSGDGAMLALADGQGKVSLTRAADGAPVRSLASGTQVTALAFAAQDSVLAGIDHPEAGKSDLVTWRLADGKELTRKALPADTVGGVFSADGARLAVYGGTAPVTIWRTRDGAREAGLAEGRKIVTVAFSPDGALLATGGEDGKVVLVKIADATAVGSVAADGPVLAVGFSPDGTTLVTSDAQKAHLFQVADGARVRDIVGCRGAFAFSTDGRMLAGLAEGTTVRTWGVADGIVEDAMEGHSAAPLLVRRLADGGVLVVTHRDVALWKLGAMQ